MLRVFSSWKEAAEDPKELVMSRRGGFGKLYGGSDSDAGANFVGEGMLLQDGQLNGNA